MNRRPSIPTLFLVAVFALGMVILQAAFATDICFYDDDILICPGKPPVIIFTD